MERISIFNYEAFYLDYLEGNLSEADTKMLLEFLEEHPECRMEDEDLVLLDDSAPMTFSGKQNLKQVDEADPIALENVEHFMIADAEGILNDQKKAELDTVVAENEDLEATRRRYNAVYYTPDESLVYGAKGDLKQRRALVMWPYFSAAVAAAAVVVLVLLPNSFDDSVTGIDVSQASVVPVGSEKPTNEDPVEKPEIKPISEQINTSDVYAAQLDPKETSEKPVIRLNPMNRRSNQQIKPVNISGDVASRPVNVGEPVDWTSTGTQVSFAPDMESPIEPVTAFISDKAKTDVEFKRRKASKEKKGGFLLKIGKFELSRNKH